MAQLQHPLPLLKGISKHNKQQGVIMKNNEVLKLLKDMQFLMKHHAMQSDYPIFKYEDKMYNNDELLKGINKAIKTMEKL